MRRWAEAQGPARGKYRRVVILFLVSSLLLAFSVMYCGWRSGEDSGNTPISAGPAQPEVPADLNEGALPPEPKEQEPEEKEAGCILQGEVTDQDGNPVSDAVVSVSSGDGEQDAGKELLDLLQTDENGAFEVRVPRPNETYLLGAMANDLLPAGLKVFVPEEGLRGVNLTLERPCSIDGRVVDGLGNPVEGIVIKTLANSASHPTDQAGAFSLAGLRSGTHTLTSGIGAGRVQHSGSWRALGGDGTETPEVEVTLSPGEHRAGVVIRLSGADAQDAIEGFAHDPEGSPVAGVNVWATSSSPAGRPRGLASAQSDERGHFRINTVDDSHVGPDGTLNKAPVTVVARAEGYEEAFAPGVPWGTRNLELTLVPVQRGPLAGVVLERGSRKPVVDVRVSVWQVYTDWGDRWRPGYSGGEDGANCDSRTDSAGRFELGSVRPGEVTLEVAHRDYGVSLHREAIRVAPDAATAVEVLLDPPGSLSVQVRPAATIEDAEFMRCSLEIFPLDVLEFRDQEPWPFSYGNVGSTIAHDVSAAMRFGQAVARQGEGAGLQRTSDDLSWAGTFDLAPGEYTVTLCALIRENTDSVDHRRPVFTLSREVRVVAGRSAQLQFEVGGGSVIEGHCEAAPGERVSLLLLEENNTYDVSALRGASIPASILAHQRCTGGNALQAVCDAEGNFLFSSVAAGDYRLIAFASDAAGGQRLLHEVAVNADGGYYHTVNIP